MLRNVSAQVALLAFGAATLAGLYVGNAPATVLSRALAAMLCALLVSQLVGAANRAILRDHLQRRKLTIDREHLEACRSTEAGGEADRAAGTG